ncbi:hypothetical protein SCLCIDRAFT_26920 [Scleroderma citrinum Foug A]|uniref:Uncharacterized protein n=1 Tax=Scleroderma citrinum Foug A TaxID=1036808 RepID=A0A0C3DVK5_9AGAM|nr:hypothetical protein SCLCIDRAFT_26920 [Scleroderma citrinum Foug A]
MISGHAATLLALHDYHSPLQIIEHFQFIAKLLRADQIVRSNKPGLGKVFVRPPGFMERDAKMVKVKILRGIVWPRGSNYINRKAVGKSSFDDHGQSRTAVTAALFDELLGNRLVTVHSDLGFGGDLF